MRQDVKVKVSVRNHQESGGQSSTTDVEVDVVNTQETPQYQSPNYQQQETAETWTLPQLAALAALIVMLGIGINVLLSPSPQPQRVYIENNYGEVNIENE